MELENTVKDEQTKPEEPLILTLLQGKHHSI